MSADKVVAILTVVGKLLTVVADAVSDNINGDN